MSGFAWRNWIRDGGQQVSPFFDTPEEAGRWRRDHPPLIDGQGPTLVHFIDGEQVTLEVGELATAFTMFAGFREPLAEAHESGRLDYEPIEFP